MLMSVSKKISKLELKTLLENRRLSNFEMFICMNLEPTDLQNLKMLSFTYPVFDMVQMTHIMTELEARPEFIVKYKGNLDVEMAEKLGNWLTLPNFEWNLIKVKSREEFKRAENKLCMNNGIDLKRIFF